MQNPIPDLDQLPGTIQLHFGGRWHNAVRDPNAETTTYVVRVNHRHLAWGRSIGLRVCGIPLLQRFHDGRARLLVEGAA